MCIACGTQWPLGTHRVHLAPPPTKEETIFIDDNTAFYPDYRQGIHPPGPVYQGIGAAAPTMFGPGLYGAGMGQMPGMAQMPGMMYGAGAAMGAGMGMGVGMGTYGIPNMCNYQVTGMGAPQFMFPQTGLPMMPGQFPLATSPADLTAQAAAAAEHNKQIASMPNAPPYMFGPNPVDFGVQNAMFGQAMGMQQGPMAAGGFMMGGAAPTTLAPVKPGEANQFWCRETDGAWTLRNYSEICLGEVSPGHWEKHAMSGYFFWVRHHA